MRLSLSPAVETLRSELLQWLSENPPPVVKKEGGLDEFVRVSRGWQRQLAAARFAGTFFPAEFGGRGAGLVEEAVVQEELARSGAPQLVGMFGLTMVGPVLLKHGTVEQKQRFVSKILSAEEIWCQGFSEPEAGSDLASLRTTARLEGDNFIVNGQKVWTSFAQYAEWCFLLVRSDESEKRHKGLSYLLVRMDSPGISIRPLRQITGEAEFNEVFFENVKVPKDQIVGAPGQGWEIAISTLMFERIVLTLSRHLQSEQLLASLNEVVKRKKSDASTLERFGYLTATNMAVRALAASHLVQYSGGKSPGPEGSMDKLFWSETFQEICKFALELSPEQTAEEGEALHQYLYSRGRTIAAGTSEIQRNIIAERILGLPRR